MSNIFLLMGGQSKQSGPPPAPAFTFFLTGPSLPSGVTLTRSSVGTYVNVAGVLVAAPINQPRFEFSGATGIVILPPAVANDAYVTSQSTALTVAAPGILTNDSDPQAQAIIVNSFDSTSAHGVVACNNNGSFTYTPTTGYFGADSWTYDIKNTSGVVSTSRATVTMTINAVVSGNMTLAWASPAAGSTVTGPVTFNFTGTNLSNIVVSGPHGVLTQTNGATTATISGNTATFLYNSALDTDGTQSFSAVGTNTTSSASSGTRSFVLSNNVTAGTPTTGPTFDQGLSLGTPAQGPAPVFLPPGGKGAGTWTPVLNLTYGTVTSGGTGTGISHMIGIKMGSSQNNNTTVAGWLGRQLDILGTTITTTGFIGGTAAPYVPANSVIDLAFPMISIFGESPAIHDMAVAASGGYDSTYTTMAQRAAGLGNPIATFSPGWEQSGQWYGWSIGVGSPFQGALNPSTANYIAAYRRISIIMKQFNPNALSQFCFAIGRDPTAYWPGAYNAVTNPGGVDVITCDFYQSNVRNDTGSSLFSAAQSGYAFNAVPANLDWMVSFAQAQGVKVGLREWGAGPGGGSGSGAGANDGTYVAACLAWIASLPTGLFIFNLYANDPPADDIIAAGVNPAEQAAYKATYAQTHFSGTWWKGAATPTQTGNSLNNPTITSLAPLGNYVVACNNCGGPPTPNLYGTYGAMSTVPASWNQLDKSIFVPGGNQTMRQNGFVTGEPFSIGPNYLRVTMTAATSPNVASGQVNTGRFSPALFTNPRISGIDFIGETAVRMTAQAGQPFPFIWYAWWFTAQGYDFEIDTVETFGFNNASPKTSVNQNSPCELAHCDAVGANFGSQVTQSLSFTTSGGAWTLNFDFRQWVTMQMCLFANGTWSCYWSGTLSDGTTVANRQVAAGSYTSVNPIGLEHDQGWFGPSGNSRTPSGTEPSSLFPFFYDYQYLRYWFR